LRTTTFLIRVNKYSDLNFVLLNEQNVSTDLRRIYEHKYYNHHYTSLKKHATKKIKNYMAGSSMQNHPWYK